MNNTFSYNLSDEDILEMIANYDRCKENADQALDLLSKINEELRVSIATQKPLSEDYIAYLTGLRKPKKKMRLYIKLLPDFFKDIDSDNITTTLSEEYLDDLRYICDDAKKWKEEYNSTVRDYKAYSRVYKMVY